ncbi:MAG: hypothetical protein A2Z91_09095 [Deltaproteobacteria bacterium GWA2_38_16]|nr:MAG: hypothetical protein A2Z91_09095 [Deltaproteobacteria bacterium GWA2_38_16]OGQ02546.1 MAG: hypothetical protein A3D19_09635 [Deltaproteobacteria bacterium RIFCSPHIGHO2_02_FULL_38_15]OGQ34126.1 MAG: hypothetical protein A3A72_04000 [Deltaproteobacteria bacterium RIFCSPLOWO2_01_FULL_38_9]OGQ60374.1 MAG: hypothetical protein A3G92_03285 [Deltaproteobacteria bacterium RIFCSPLOWO2_12_FULL_38_8]HBQ20999.1 hypothetical protein [Deltaproteobacteria bacterium]
MKGPIKGVLKEELGNSLRMKRQYESVLKKLPKGSLALRKIGGHDYYYLVQRYGKKVKYVYRGKVARKEIERYAEAKKLRAKYRNLLSQVKKQIKFLKGTLRGKEAI